MTQAMMRMRAAGLLSLAVLSTGAGLASPAFAQQAEAWPAKPIRLVVPFAAGGGTDMVGRVMAPRLAERLGRPVLVENRGGAGAVIGTTLVARAIPDGYTLLVVDTAHTIQPVLQKLDYDPVKSFSLIASMVKGDTVLTVPASLPVNTLQEFIALARQKPGTLVAGTAGLGSSGHMGVELLRVMAKIDMVIAHYKGGGAATSDLLGGQIHMSSITIQAVIPHARAGRLRGLGVGGATRSPLMPEVPTVQESGLPGYLTTGWRGLVGPAGIPAPIVKRLTDEVRTILASEEVRTHFVNNGMETDYRAPREFAAYIADELRRWEAVVQKANIRLE
ncbi:MAG: Bug family tripartite tricarboxylate transporter substrate binding protein [bacterium]|jgi:tripartite-type tricarboxylate transporter receptor subunit TctC|nr:tripartite tricarboxylate transporter substrate binding protein [Betaproteobacteria bacterium]